MGLAAIGLLRRGKERLAALRENGFGHHQQGLDDAVCADAGVEAQGLGGGGNCDSDDSSGVGVHVRGEAYRSVAVLDKSASA